MKNIFLFFLVFLSSAPVFAIEGLFPCEDLLNPRVYQIDDKTSVALEENQILVKGHLLEFWETGMEDQTGWSLEDVETYEKISANRYHALHILKPGTKVFLLKEDGSIWKTGFYGETKKKKTLSWGGRNIEVAPNRPMLYAEPELKTPLIAENVLVQAFTNEMKAAAIFTLSKGLKERRLDLMKNDYESYQKNKTDPTRFVRIGDLMHELSHFEEVVRGKIRVDETERPAIVYDSINKEIVEGPMEKVRKLVFIPEDGSAEVTDIYYNKIFILDKNDNVIKIHNSLLPSDTDLDPGDHAVMVRKRG